MGFVYGIPILLIGLSLKYAQLDPVPVEVRTEKERKRKTHGVRRLMIEHTSETHLYTHIQTSVEANRLFEEKATATLRKIKQDVTRHRYVRTLCLCSSVFVRGARQGSRSAWWIFGERGKRRRTTDDSRLRPSTAPRATGTATTRTWTPRCRRWGW